MSHRGHEHDVRIRWVDDDAADLLNVGKADMLPGAPAVRRLEDSVPDAEVRPVQSFPAADVDDVRVRRRDGNVSDRSRGRIVEDRLPGPAVVVGLPHAAVIHAHHKDARPRRHAGAADRSACAEGTNQSVAKLLIQRRVEAGGIPGALRRDDCGGGGEHGQRKNVSGSHEV
jgi:hypothetical protein